MYDKFYKYVYMNIHVHAYGTNSILQLITCDVLLLINKVHCSYQIQEAQHDNFPVDWYCPLVHQPKLLQDPHTPGWRSLRWPPSIHTSAFMWFVHQLYYLSILQNVKKIQADSWPCSSLVSMFRSGNVWLLKFCIGIVVQHPFRHIYM